MPVQSSVDIAFLTAVPSEFFTDIDSTSHAVIAAGLEMPPSPPISHIPL